MFFFVHGLINLIESKVGKVLVYVYGFTDFVKKNYVLQVVDVFLVLALLCCSSWKVWSITLCKETNLDKVRPHSVSITEFGAVGDGITLNTKSFQNAIFYLNSFSDKGGAKLFVPAGRWLTGSFDLISHLTLWLDKDAVILGSTVRSQSLYAECHFQFQHNFLILTNQSM
jgi:hypothetical protein